MKSKTFFYFLLGIVLFIGLSKIPNILSSVFLFLDQVSFFHNIFFYFSVKNISMIVIVSIFFSWFVFTNPEKMKVNGKSLISTSEKLTALTVNLFAIVLTSGLVLLINLEVTTPPLSYWISMFIVLFFWFYFLQKFVEHKKEALVKERELREKMFSSLHQRDLIKIKK